jgi:hypothetical protein
MGENNQSTHGSHKVTIAAIVVAGIEEYCNDLQKKP